MARRPGRCRLVGYGGQCDRPQKDGSIAHHRPRRTCGRISPARSSARAAPSSPRFCKAAPKPRCSPASSGNSRLSGISSRRRADPTRPRALCAGDGIRGRKTSAPQPDVDASSEHAPEKLNDFSDILDIGYIRVLIDENMLQLFDFERVLFDRMIPALGLCHGTPLPNQRASRIKRQPQKPKYGAGRNHRDDDKGPAEIRRPPDAHRRARSAPSRSRKRRRQSRELRDNCCATAVKLVARLIAAESISA